MKTSVALGCLLAWAFTAAAQTVSERPAPAMPFNPATPMARISPHTTRPMIAGTADHFAGAVHIEPLFDAQAPARATGGLVRFEPGAHTAWHTHPLGQTLIVTAGNGAVQFWGGQAQQIKTGDVVWIPAGQKHWHGAGPATAMAHIAIQEQLHGHSADWLEPVTDAQYRSATAVQHAAQAAPPPQPSRAQQLMGDIAPKLAELTDKVLFGDIWARPELARRDRSLVTVSALIATNHPDQLRAHLALARDNGLTQQELIEAITHLAFYTGWPNAVSAIGVTREVFSKP